MSARSSASKRTQIKLSYFNSNGRASTARLILAVANVKYDDERLDADEDWPAVKDDSKRFPLGKMPVLTINDLVLVEAAQIDRYLGEEYGLSGNTALERAKVNIVGGINYEIFDYFTILLGAENPHRNDKVMKYLTATEFLQKMTPVMENLEKSIKLYGGNGFSVGNKMTWADLSIFMTFKAIQEVFGDEPLENLPEITNIYNKVGQNNLVREHIEKRRPCSA